MNLYNRTMPSQFAYEMLKKKQFVFLYATPGNHEFLEKRGVRVREQVAAKACYEIQYFYVGASDENTIVEGFNVKNDSGVIEKYNSLRKKDMLSFAESINAISKTLLVDFTLMNTRFLGAFCACLNKFEWEEVFFCYTEPGSYKKSNNEFALYNNNMGFEQIPGLETFSDGSTEYDWVVFLGFESSRLAKLEEESSTNRRNSLPFICIPAMKINWHNVAFDENRDYFELKKRDQNSVGFVSAINPYETYEKLSNMKDKNANVRLVVSPIGPKPVMLGCVMFVLENPDEMLLFDNPVQDGNNTEEFGETHFYDMSQFVHSIKNERFI